MKRLHPATGIRMTFCNKGALLNLKVAYWVHSRSFSISVKTEMKIIHLKYWWTLSLWLQRWYFITLGYWPFLTVLRFFSDPPGNICVIL